MITCLSPSEDTRIFYTMGYHKTGSVLLIRLVQRAMVALGANLQNLVCRAGEKSNPTVTYPYFGIKKNDLKVGEAGARKSRSLL